MREGDGIRTRDGLLGRQVLHQPELLPVNGSNLDQIGQTAVKCDLPPIVVPLLMLQLPAFETVTDGALWTFRLSLSLSKLGLTPSVSP